MGAYCCALARFVQTPLSLSAWWWMVAQNREELRSMEEYGVPIQNEVTGETMVVCVTALSAKDAQVQALTQVFRQHGWRKTCASQPHSVAPEVRSA